MLKMLEEETYRGGVLIATDRRLILYAKKLTGFEFQSFPYDTITAVEMGKSMMGHHLTVRALNTKVEFKWIGKKWDAPAFISTVRSLASAASAQGSDVAEQIRKLAALRDDGILTEHEFHAKKVAATRDLVRVRMCVPPRLGSLLRRATPDTVTPHG